MLILENASPACISGYACLTLFRRYRLTQHRQFDVLYVDYLCQLVF